MKMKDREGALRTLDEIVKQLPGTEVAVWAATAADLYRKDPEGFEEADEKTPEALARKLDAKDEAVVKKTLGEMRQRQWDALPAAVYRLLAPQAGSPEVRSLAVQLICAQEDPRTVTILEILLFHPKEKDPDLGVRREAAKGLAKLPTAGIVPILYRALDDGDAEIREAAVRGIAAITGKYFRERLETATPAADWPKEREMYSVWWRTRPDASIAKREATAALAKLFAPIQQGRKRLAEYCLPSLDDSDARTWRAGYDLFRSLTGQDLGAATTPAAGEVSAEERARIAAACRTWLAENADKD
jgi:HEAT repeat protein